MRLRIVPALLLGLLIGGVLLGKTPVQARTAQRYFPETGQNVDGLFLQFWQNNGGVTVYGYPISCEGRQWIEDAGSPGYYTVQWFQRFRMENHVGHPVLNDVELGRMGLEVLASEIPPRANLGNGSVTFSPQPPIPGCDYHTPFGQNLCNPFRSAWNASGRLAQNGYPVSDFRNEYVWDPDKNNRGYYDLQWFERVRFEIHTNWPVGAQVGRGLLGSMLYYKGGDPANPPEIVVNCGVAPSNISLVRYSELGLTTETLALEDTALYGQDGMVAALFTPVADLPIVAASELVNQIQQGDLGVLNGQPLGALTVVGPGIQLLAPDDYVLTVNANGTIVFTGKDSLQLPVTVYNLPSPLSRPVAFVTATQKCVAWAQIKLCAESPAPQRDAVFERIVQAVEELKQIREDLQLEQINIKQAVALVAGADQLNSCANGLKGDQANYADCQALVIAAPAVTDGAFSAPDESGPITGIGILVVLNEAGGKDIPAIREEVFADPALTKPLGTLPTGAYLVYDVQVDTERKPADGTRITSVRLSGPQGDFYLPAVNRALLSGERVYGPGADTQDAAVATSLILRDRCFLRAGRCHQPR
jgi:hypothetical protein